MSSIQNDETVDENILQKYQIIKKLGSGAYGHVWKVIDKTNKKQYALKKVYSAFQNNLDSQRTYRQISILSKLNHQNIVKLVHVYRAKNNYDLYLLFELIQSDLFKAIKGNFLNQIHKKYIIYQIAKSLKYIHSGGILHRDIKPSNILINTDCKIKICDFGLSRTTYVYKKKSGNDNKKGQDDKEGYNISKNDVNQIKQSILNNKSASSSAKNILSSPNPTSDQPLITQFIATRWYRAPEVMLGSQFYTSKADIWSFGCLIYQMYAHKALLPGKDNVDQIQKLLQFKGFPTQQQKQAMRVKNIDKILGHFTTEKKLLNEYFSRIQDVKLKKLLLSIFEYDPNKRPSAEQILKNSFLQDFLNYEKQQVLTKKIKLEHNQNVKVDADEYKKFIYEMFADKEINNFEEKNSQKSIMNQKSVNQQRRSIVERTMKNKSNHSLAKNNQNNSPQMVIAMPAKKISSKKSNKQIPQQQISTSQKQVSLKKLKKNQNQSEKKIKSEVQKLNKVENNNIQNTDNLNLIKRRKQKQNSQNLTVSYVQNPSLIPYRHTMDDKHLIDQQKQSKIHKRSIKYKNIQKNQIQQEKNVDKNIQSMQIKQNISQDSNIKFTKNQNQPQKYLKKTQIPIQVLKTPSIVYYNKSSNSSQTAPSSPKKLSASLHNDLILRKDMVQKKFKQEEKNIMRQSSSNSFHIKPYGNKKKIVNNEKQNNSFVDESINKKSILVSIKEKPILNNQQANKLVNQSKQKKPKMTSLSSHNPSKNQSLQISKNIKSKQTSNFKAQSLHRRQQSLGTSIQYSKSQIFKPNKSKLPQLIINKGNNLSKNNNSEVYQNGNEQITHKIHRKSQSFVFEDITNANKKYLEGGNDNKKRVKNDVNVNKIMPFTKQTKQKQKLSLKQNKATDSKKIHKKGISQYYSKQGNQNL